MARLFEATFEFADVFFQYATISLTNQLHCHRYMAAHGVQPGDAVITVNGEDFDTIGEFAALTKVSPNMVMQTFHIPETPGFYEDDAEGMKVLQEYVLKHERASAT